MAEVEQFISSTRENKDILYKPLETECKSVARKRCKPIPLKNSIVQVGLQAPTFHKKPAVIDGTLKELSLDDFRGKWVILFFYISDFNPVCQSELIEFNKRRTEFNLLNCEIIACSVDSERSHLAWARAPKSEWGLENEIKFPIISDVNRELAKKYGALNDEGYPSRNLFILDSNHIIRQVIINDEQVGRSVHEPLRILKACQSYDSTGEPTVANWNEQIETQPMII